MKNFGTTRFGKFIKKNYKLLILFFSLTLLNIFFLCWSFASNDLAIKSSTFIIMLLSSVFLEIILCIIIFIAKYKSWKIEKIFLILGLIIGVFYVFALPIGRAPDEESHFFRIYEITQGQIFSSASENGIDHGSVQASNIEIVRDYKENNVKYTDIVNSLSIYPNDDNQSFIKNSASSYSPINYAPHIAGMTLGKVLHLPIFITAYLAKLFNCIICILILYFCIKYIPFLKEFIFLIAFLPITMQAMTSLSADGFITVIAIALVSFILYATYSLKTKFTKKHFIILFALCLILSLSKIVYALLCLLLFTIPKARFGTNKRKLITIFSIGAICFVFLIIWFLLSSTTLNSATDFTNQDTLINNPLLFLSILIKSISTNFVIYLTGVFGGYLEWFNIVLSPLYLFPSLVIFILLCQKVRTTFFINKDIRILSIIIFLIITLATFTAMFISWTKPGETTIDGVQGRYFLPILLLIPLAFISSKQSKDKTLTKPKPTLTFKQNYYLYGFYIFESIYAITSIACSHL